MTENTQPQDCNVTAPHYPVNLSIDYCEKLSRVKTLFRIILIIPIVILFMTIGGGIAIGKTGAYLGAGGALILAPLLMILFRKRYPRWWFDWNHNLLRFQQNVSTYFFCLIDEYPSVDGSPKVRVDIDYPESDDLMRGMPLIKWLLAIPHYIVLIALSIVALIVLIIGWFAVLFTARYPRPLFNYIVGYHRYGLRVLAYAFLMMTDKYPPFRLKP